MKSMNQILHSFTNRSHLTVAFAALAACLAAGCSDPADKVHKSAGSEAQDAAASPSSGKQYVFSPESKIGFVGSKVTGSHEGGFKTFTGSINVANGKVVGSEIKIDMTSTWSDSDRLTGHLKSPDFFDVEKFPASTFTITSIEASGAQQTVTGNLDLHGVSKSVTFPADIQVAADAVTVKAEFAINRKDFNITYPGKPDDLIRDNVVLKLDVKATPAS